MAKKLTKNVLKSIIKECLVEILQEGFGSTLTEQLSNKRVNPVIKENNSSRANERSRSVLDSVSRGNENSASDLRVNENFDKRVHETVNQMTDDPILSEILSDTARKTLQNQIAGERTQPAIAGADPLSVFGNSAKNWSKLAFND
jgi:hypothetical protein